MGIVTYQPYQRRHVRDVSRTEKSLTITRRGNIYFTPRAVEAFDLERKSHVTLSFDDDLNQIYLKFHDSPQYGSLKVFQKIKKDEDGAEQVLGKWIAAKAALAFFNLIPPAGSYLAEDPQLQYDKTMNLIRIPYPGVLVNKPAHKNGGGKSERGFRK